MLLIIDIYRFDERKYHPLFLAKTHHIRQCHPGEDRQRNVEPAITRLFEREQICEVESEKGRDLKF